MVVTASPEALANIITQQLLAFLASLAKDTSTSDSTLDTYDVFPPYTTAELAIETEFFWQLAESIRLLGTD